MPVNALTLIFVKIGLNLKSEASRFYLSYLWWVIEPIVYMISFYFVFGKLLHRGTEDFVAYLLCGLIPWLWFSKTISHAMNSLLQYKNLILQVKLSITIFPAIVIGQNFIKQLVVFLLLLAFLLVYGVHPTVTWLYLPVLIFIQLVLIAGFSFVVAILVPFVRDLQFIITAGLQLLMFLSGIFYATDVIAPQYQDMFFMNPVAALIKAYRDILLYNAYPDWHRLVYIFIESVAILAVTYLWIRRFGKSYPRVVI